MRKRTLARELVLQALYQADVRKEPLSAVAEEFFKTAEIEDPQDVLPFAQTLIQGIEQNLKQLDAEIVNHAANWNINRMAVIDRNILRLGIYEILFMPDIPSKVSINEAIELAKKFGDVESSKFVNGILDKVHKVKAQDGPPA